MAASLEKNLIPKLTSSLPDVEALRLFLTLPECPLMSDSNNYMTLAIPFAAATVNLEKAPLKVLGKVSLKKSLQLCGSSVYYATEEKCCRLCTLIYPYEKYCHPIKIISVIFGPFKCWTFNYIINHKFNYSSYQKWALLKFSP